MVPTMPGSSEHEKVRGRPTVVGVLVVAAVLFALLSVPAHPHAQAQEGPSVRVELERSQVEVGESFDAFIYIENAEDLVGFDLVLAYDETFLSYQGVEIGYAFLESGGRSAVALGPNERPNRVEVGAVTVPDSGQAGANGAGDLAVFAFRALAAGETTLDLVEIRLVDAEGDTAEPEGEDGVLQIGEPATPTPEQPVMRPGAFLPWLAKRAR